MKDTEEELEVSWDKAKIHVQTGTTVLYLKISDPDQ